MQSELLDEFDGKFVYVEYYSYDEGSVAVAGVLHVDEEADEIAIQKDDDIRVLKLRDVTRIMRTTKGAIPLD
jgi:hypothetical protein